MGRTLLIAALASALVSCGDAIIAIGDQPGFMRITAGQTPTNGIFLYNPIATQVRFANPSGLAADSAANVFIADQATVIARVTPTGQFSVLYQSINCKSSACVSRPQALALSADGSALLISDDANGKLWKLTIASHDLSVVADSLADPTGVVVLPDGRILVAERSADRVSVIGTNGNVASFHEGLNGPSGLALSGNTLYVAEVRSNTVRAVDITSGASQVVAGNGISSYSGDGGPAIAAALNRPWALAVSGANLYIADQGNHRVRVVNTETGGIGTFAGTGSTTFSGNGLSAGATALNNPDALTISPLGFLYISDPGHGVIWRTPIRLI